jgi:para-nitrobenzyl esterase
VQTDCGAVSGAVDSAKLSNASVFRYSSIPFAKPPLGDLRWRAPAARSCPWAGTLNGSAVPSECVQHGGLSGDEDCLYLHVVRPAADPPPGGWPVLVYFHGGNLISGGTPGMIGPSAVMATQVAGGSVVVAIAYRLNVLGWLADDAFSDESGFAGNYGALDAVAGLQWVQANVGAFGGDKTRVVIFGQSSGGTLIFTLLAMPSADGLFAAAFSMSGSPNITMPAAVKRAQDAPIVAALGCGGETGAARAACLRSKPALMVGAAMPPSWGTPGIFGWLKSGLPPPPGGMAYAGIMHVDGVVVTLPLVDALAAQTVNASVVISNMEAECDGGPAITVRNQTAAQWAATVASAFAAWPGGGAAEAAAVVAGYAAELAADVQLAYDSISADYGLTCAGRAIAQQLQANSSRTRPIYLLFNALQQSAAQWSPSGDGRWPFHGLDLRLLSWGWGAAPDAADLAEAALMQRFLGDLASNRGELPAAWAWPPAAGPGAPQGVWTMVFAQQDGFPGGGVRAVLDFKAGQCGAGVLGALAGPEFWWVD